MSITMLQAFFLWCFVINYGLLILWAILTLLPNQALYRFGGKPLKVTEEQFNACNFFGIVLYKLLVIVFAVVPYIALRMVG